MSQCIFSDVTVTACVCVCLVFSDWNGQMCHCGLLGNVKPCLVGLFDVQSDCPLDFLSPRDSRLSLASPHLTV